MRKFLFLLIGFIIFTFTGCTEKVRGDEKTAMNYVESKGYKITDRIGEKQRYVLDKSMLYGKTGSIQYQLIWGLQTVEPDKFIGKEIIVYGFTVKNHPLEKKDKNAKDGVNVYIMISQGKIIGGYSYLNVDMVGSYNSIDGKSLEEVTGLNFQEWQEKWKEKYGN